MRVFLLVIAICSCLGHPCFRAMKTYIAECEVPVTVDSEYCKNKRQEVINGGCEQIVKDFDICKGDLRKLCSPDNENPRGCFGRCLINKMPQLSSECANTETVKRIVERIKSGRFPNIPEIGNDAPKPPQTPDANVATPPSADGLKFPPSVGDRPTLPPMNIPPPAKDGDEFRPGFDREPRHRVKHSEVSGRSDFYREGHHYRRFHRCGRKGFFVILVVALSLTVGLCWALRERQRRAFLRRSRVTSTKPPGSWSTGLFGSWDKISPDWKTCLPSFLFPCYQSAFNQSELQDRDCTFADLFFNLCLWNRYSNTYRDRQEIRAQQNIPEDCGGDCLASIICNPCAIAQNAREIDIRTCAQGGTNWPSQKLPDTWVPAKADIV